MAYPTVSSPYGLKPINLIGGQPYAGSTRTFKIASGYDQSIFNGDLVKIKRYSPYGELPLGAVTGMPVDGTIIVQPCYRPGVTNSGSFLPGAPLPYTIGVFMGCSYTDPVLKYKVFSQYFPAGLVADDIEAVVVDDPDALFKVVYLTDIDYSEISTTGIVTSTTVGDAPDYAWGANVYWVYNGGNANTGNSLSGVSAAPLQAYGTAFEKGGTAGQPFRVVDVVPATATDSGFKELIVKLNPHAANSGDFIGGHEYDWPGASYSFY